MFYVYTTRWKFNIQRKCNNFKYTFKLNEMIIRTEHKYAQQVQESIRKNEIFEGIKGSTYLSKIKTTTMWQQQQ
jgi:hypothetical protein